MSRGEDGAHGLDSTKLRLRFDVVALPSGPEWALAVAHPRPVDDLHRLNAGRRGVT
ncbi:MAG: hypothetical protein AVDCRST_MAG76-3446 [uncultured Acidimicrobiales bacterium]|uniref:Uncharacterized protein n=1 Tax=uncultured Acidimicrobiales bacterium TaxID=310071 RepID=A0A6J4J8S1_9ACTN|nr:MAG: hypothetical protein AVDCRST_MAG76-3446 [uncultured Acidimicrobiales bacterium]